MKQLKPRGRRERGERVPSARALSAQGSAGRPLGLAGFPDPGWTSSRTPALARGPRPADGQVIATPALPQPRNNFCAAEIGLISFQSDVD